MGTNLQDVYDAFLAKMLEDDWTVWDKEEAKEDWKAILEGAIPYFKFPKKSLAFSGDNFVEELNNIEIQILATYMKVEWLNRTILTWENVKPRYDEKYFSQANLSDKFRQLLEREEKKAHRLESMYERSIDVKPCEYGKLTDKG